MNKAILTGRLTKDPEHRTTPNGVSVTTFTVAVNRRYITEVVAEEVEFNGCKKKEESTEATYETSADELFGDELSDFQQIEEDPNLPF